MTPGWFTVSQWQSSRGEGAASMAGHGTVAIPVDPVVTVWAACGRARVKLLFMAPVQVAEQNTKQNHEFY